MHLNRHVSKHSQVAVHIGECVGDAGGRQTQTAGHVNDGCQLSRTILCHQQIKFIRNMDTFYWLRKLLAKTQNTLKHHREAIERHRGLKFGKHSQKRRW